MRFSRTALVKSIILIIFLLLVSACVEQSEVDVSQSQGPTESDEQHGQHSVTTNIEPPVKTAEDQLLELQQKITYGNASIVEVKRALSDTDDVAGLANTIHSLYSMRWHRGVINLLNDLWTNQRNKHPELTWQYLEKVPVRIALASTITRIQIFNTDEYKEYIRSHKYDEHEFHRAQVVISLALNGDPIDVAYISEMAETDNIYVSQSAITSLGLMANPQARDAMLDLARKYKSDDPRGKLIREVFQKAYPVKG